MRRKPDKSVSAIRHCGAPRAQNPLHVDFYFIFEIDIAILAFEAWTSDITLETAQDLMFRLGRAYPAFWGDNGQGGHCPSKVELISHDGQTLSMSDYENREKCLKQVCVNRICIGTWRLLGTSVLETSSRRFRGKVLLRSVFRSP